MLCDFLFASYFVRWSSCRAALRHNQLLSHMTGSQFATRSCGWAAQLTTQGMGYSFWGSATRLCSVRACGGFVTQIAHHRAVQSRHCNFPCDHVTNPDTVAEFISIRVLMNVVPNEILASSSFILLLINFLFTNSTSPSWFVHAKCTSLLFPAAQTCTDPPLPPHIFSRHKSGKLYFRSGRDVPQNFYVCLLYMSQLLDSVTDFGQFSSWNWPTRAVSVVKVGEIPDLHLPSPTINSGRRSLHGEVLSAGTITHEFYGIYEYLFLLYLFIYFLFPIFWVDCPFSDGTKSSGYMVLPAITSPEKEKKMMISHEPMSARHSRTLLSFRARVLPSSRQQIGRTH